MFTCTVNILKLCYSQFLKGSIQVRLFPAVWGVSYQRKGKRRPETSQEVCTPRVYKPSQKNQIMHISTHPKWPCSVLPHQYVWVIRGKTFHFFCVPSIHDRFGFSVIYEMNPVRSRFNRVVRKLGDIYSTPSVILSLKNQRISDCRQFSLFKAEPGSLIRGVVSSTERCCSMHKVGEFG